MDEKLKQKEEELELASLDDQIAEKRSSIAQKRALEREMKAKYGSGWRKILGFVGKIKPDQEALHTLYSMNPDLKRLNAPSPKAKWY
jgi:hypothetical protein